MHRSGKFDIVDDSPGHVTSSQPIRKSLLHLRPDKLFRRSSKHTDETAQWPAVCRLKSEDVSTARKTETIERTNQSRLPTATTSPVSVAEYQPQYTAVVAKRGEEFKPEVEYVQHVQPTRSFERTGSLRDRWQQLNEEFKRLYQRRAASPEATPPRGHVLPFQGQSKVTKVNRFKDVDRRFSDVSRAVGNMSARQLHNTTSGQAGVTSSKQPAATSEDTYARLQETEEECTSERHMNAKRRVYTGEPVLRRQSLAEAYQRHRPSKSPTLADSESVGWYLDSQSTLNRQSNNEIPSTGLNKLLPSRRENNVLGRRQTERTTLAVPSGECECKTSKYADTTMTSFDDDTRWRLINRSRDRRTSRDVNTGDKQQITMVILTTLS